MRALVFVATAIGFAWLCVGCPGGTSTKPSTQTSGTCVTGAMCSCATGAVGGMICDAATKQFVQCDCQGRTAPARTMNSPSNPAQVVSLPNEGSSASTSVAGAPPGPAASAGAGGQ